MPELPEVETIKNDLAAVLPGKKIALIEARLKKTLKSGHDLIREIQGRRVQEVSRTGKLVAISAGDHFVVFHLKMTGQLVYCGPEEIVPGGHSEPPAGCYPNKYTHLVVAFSDGSNLFFNDIRQFGYVKIVNAEELGRIRAKYGPDPVADDFSFSYVDRLFSGSKKTVKGLLLDQSKIAGIGNIYADEICYRAGVMPDRRSRDLSARERKKLFKSMKSILKKAIKLRGTTFNDYVDASGRKGKYLKMLKVYQRTGQPCLGCGNIVQRSKVAGRSTHFCPKCQR